MDQALEKLIRLQQLDLEIRQLRASLEATLDLTARELPPGDGGLAVGQALLAAGRACVPRVPG